MSQLDQENQNQTQVLNLIPILILKLSEFRPVIYQLTTKGIGTKSYSHSCQVQDLLHIVMSMSMATYMTMIRAMAVVVVVVFARCKIYCAQWRACACACACVCACVSVCV